MFRDFLINLNIIDIIVAGIVMRCIYIGATKGVLVEIFKLLGMFFATFVVLHFYRYFGVFLHKFLIIPIPVGELLAFVILWLIVFFIFKMLSDGWMLVLKTEAHPLVDKTGGTIIGVARGILVSGLAFILIFVSGNTELVESVRESGSGYYLLDLSPNIYNTTFDNFICKFFPDEEKNETLFELIAEKEEE